MLMTIKQNCLVCKQDSHNAICHFCVEDLTLFDVDNYQHNLMLAPKIKLGLAKVEFEQVLAISDYIWPLSRLLTGLKFSARVPNAYALAKLFVDHGLKTYSTLPELLIPLPLHKKRYLLRKYNQSAELAKHIAKLSAIPMDTSIMSRVKATQAQTDLTAAQRRKNLRNAFHISDKAQHKLQTYQHVALFDDVITTGTTMNCAYQTLTQHNPHLTVDIWSICITLVR